MQKNTIMLSTIVFFITAIMLVIPFVWEAYGANNTFNYFNVTVTIGNSAPTITGIATRVYSPIEGSTVTVSILFNVTDSNGYADIDPATETEANITKNGVVLSDTACANYAAWTGGNVRGVNCTIDVEYYREPGLWNISVSATDGSGSDSDIQEKFTYNTLYAFTISHTSIDFTSASAGTTTGSTNDPQILNNTGNGAFASINLTGYNLTDGSGNWINSTYFSVNATNDAVGKNLASDGGEILIPSASIATNSTQNLYFYVATPSGTPAGSYSTATTNEWIIEAYN